MALPEPLREPLTAWPSPELEAQQATIEFAAMATGLKADSLTWEFQLFCKLLYRHKNQHRNTLSFRHLLEVQHYFSHDMTWHDMNMSVKPSACRTEKRLDHGNAMKPGSPFTWVLQCFPGCNAE